MTPIRTAAAGVLLITATACTSGPAQVSASPTDAIALLDCQGANRTGDPGPRRFTKDGLYVRRGASFDLIVPDDWRDRLTINWGFPGEATHHLRVPGCRPTGTINPIHEQDPWLVYAGGYTVSEPACASLVVKAGQTQQTVRIGVGAACLGQGPPPPPV